MPGTLPFFVSIPHSGERIPDECQWLHSLPEKKLMCDVDRYVDRLYEPTLQSLKIPYVKTEWHRYAVDLNRVPADVDAASVVGAASPAGTHPRGYHWVITTKEERLMPAPMDLGLHKKLTQLIYEPFHAEVRKNYQILKDAGHKEVFHLDLHSMPSLGTDQHRDPGERRADIVVSDCQGSSSQRAFVDHIVLSYVRAGFKVAYNWPYFGGRVSEQYGLPTQGQHAVQVELNRALYMDEDSKAYRQDLAQVVVKKLKTAMDNVLTYWS